MTFPLATPTHLLQQLNTESTKCCENEELSDASSKNRNGLTILENSLAVSDKIRHTNHMTCNQAPEHLLKKWKLMFMWQDYRDGEHISGHQGLGMRIGYDHEGVAEGAPWGWQESLYPDCGGSHTYL